MTEYKARARAYSRSKQDKSGNVDIESHVVVEGDSPLELAAATELGKASVQGHAQAHGLIRALEKIETDYLTTKNYKLISND